MERPGTTWQHATHHYSRAKLGHNGESQAMTMTSIAMQRWEAEGKVNINLNATSGMSIIGPWPSVAWMRRMAYKNKQGIHNSESFSGQRKRGIVDCIMTRIL